MLVLKHQLQRLQHEAVKRVAHERSQGDGLLFGVDESGAVAANGHLVAAEGLSGDQESIFVVADEVVLQDGHAIGQGGELFPQNLVQELPVGLRVLLARPFQVECLRGVERCFHEGVGVCDFSEKLGGAVAGVEVDLIHSNFLVRGGIDEEVAALYRAVEHDAVDALALTALFEHCLCEQLIVRALCQILQGVGLGGNKGELVLSCHCLSVRQQSVEGRSAQFFVVGNGNGDAIADPQNPLLRPQPGVYFLVAAELSQNFERIVGVAGQSGVAVTGRSFLVGVLEVHVSPGALEVEYFLEFDFGLDEELDEYAFGEGKDGGDLLVHGQLEPGSASAEHKYLVVFVGDEAVVEVGSGDVAFVEAALRDFPDFREEAVEGGDLQGLEVGESHF